MTYLVTPLSFLILSFSFQSLSMRIRQILFPLLWHFFLLFVARQFQSTRLNADGKIFAGKPWESWNNSLTKVWLGGLWNKIFIGIFLSTLQFFCVFSGHMAGTRAITPCNLWRQNAVNALGTRLTSLLKKTGNWRGQISKMAPTDTWWVRAIYNFFCWGIEYDEFLLMEM